VIELANDHVREMAIACLTAIAVTALLRGIDSTLLSAISAVIGGIAGYTIGRVSGG
jgi:hypothetical protein